MGGYTVWFVLIHKLRLPFSTVPSWVHQAFGGKGATYVTSFSRHISALLPSVERGQGHLRGERGAGEKHFLSLRC